MANIEDTLVDLSKQNTAKNQEMAREQMDFQKAEAEKMREFNSSEAVANRKWQKEMSDTAHTREVSDLINAGLNPVLATHGAGASTPAGGAGSQSSAGAGAKGDADTSAVHSLAQIASSSVQANAMLEKARIEERIARERMQKDIEIANIHAGASVTGQEIMAGAMNYGSDTSSGNVTSQNKTSSSNANKGFVRDLITGAIYTTPLIIQSLKGGKGAKAPKNKGSYEPKGFYPGITPNYMRSKFGNVPKHMSSAVKSAGNVIKKYGVPAAAVAGSAAALGKAFDYRMKHFDEITKKTAKRRR